MATDSDTVEFVRIKHADLQWLAFAVRNVQTRNDDEVATRINIVVRFDLMLKCNSPKDTPEFVVSLTQPEALICLFAANEGRCRTCDELLIRGRLQQAFNEYTGGHWGVNA